MQVVKNVYGGGKVHTIHDKIKNLMGREEGRQHVSFTTGSIWQKDGCPGQAPLYLCVDQTAFLGLTQLASDHLIGSTAAGSITTTGEMGAAHWFVVTSHLV